MTRALLAVLAALLFVLSGCHQTERHQEAQRLRLTSPPRPGDMWSFPDVPLLASSPSVVKTLSTDPNLVLGRFPLSTRRPPVVDGDTIRVEGLGRSLRLLGIDTEETFKHRARRSLAAADWTEYLRTMYAGTNRSHPPKFGTPFGEAAKDFARRFFDGVDRVRLEYDAPERKHGYFGRYLVFVLVKKQGLWINYNVEVVRQGLSPYFRKYGRCSHDHEAFLRAQAEARKARRGIWAKKARFHHYPDYAARLAWWAKRDQDREHVRRLKQQRQNLFLLGEEAEWEALKRHAGQEVTVAGVPGRLIRKGKLGLLTIGHKNHQDFLVVGPYKKLQARNLEKEAGNLLLLTGTLSLYKGRPQFRLKDLKEAVPVSP